MVSEPAHGDLLRFLAHVHYPATKQQIVEQLVEHGAPEPHLNAVDRLPDQTYVEPDTVLQAIPPAPD